VKLRLEAEEKRYHHCRRGRRSHIAYARQRPQTESQKRGNHAGYADILTAPWFALVAERRKYADRSSDDGQNQSLRRSADLHRHAAEQSYHSEGTKAGRALAFKKFPPLPSTFKPDQQPYGQSHCQALDEAKIIGMDHGRLFVSPSKQRQPGPLVSSALMGII
jgi:hypothetical protein